MIPEALGFVLGAVLGSFIAASASRIIKEESLTGRSYCQQCKKKLRWYDLFPVFSYLILQGRCRYCKKKISLENLLVELTLGLIIAILFGSSLPKGLDNLLTLNLQSIILIANLTFKIFTVTVLSIIFLVDLKTGLIPNKITYPASLVAFFYLLFTSTFKSWEPAFFALLSAIVVSLFFSFLIIITRGKGMGWGDVKFVLFLGLALGFPGIAVGIFLAFTLGAIFSLVLIAFRKKRFGETLPFGPFLSLGALIYILWGPAIINWYLTSFFLGF
ncbi:hypothetical protein A3A14_00075 [Candidatus Daviesbacteria bacterium RIFCSPLOWO2_01_FULL_43_38]|nr:MAG: hypothetical protein A2874_03035 [Candidatus Daviesbacteria bacterium RIFCSPHIGHO2_01_FULL_43_17]OGE64005.1 MAG: hypothetical protein A3A14_00075 [Candidatus Daviesbacteria bacterium RIFCSPLOWO2_01_FULL_43_38]OGE70627.1 MAG: hypothetical protein A3J21_02490 [Candidatus Daviesbacteria bacterium RIFCSPLOWO2_02_FULL_43_11]